MSDDGFLLESIIIILLFSLQVKLEEAKILKRLRTLIQH